MNLALRFDAHDINYWAERYAYPLEQTIEEKVAPRARKSGYFTKEDFLDICRWKTPRTQSRGAQNTEEFIEAVTRTALTTPVEQLRIEVLTLLRGVNWPTASVMLHFAHRDPYPILDFRALWSLGVDTPPRYAFTFWWEYTQVCREIAERNGVTMRVLDRALWQYSKENQ